MNSGPATSVRVITASDSTVFDATRALYIGGSGDIAVKMFDGTTATLNAVPAGLYPFSVVQVLATGTTATNIRGLY